LPRLTVLAGTNGAGKSSIGGAALRQNNAPYFNPDEAARHIMPAAPELSQGEANAAAWQEGKRLLENAIANHQDFAFETTLGGSTITGLLHQALDGGIEVCIWYVGLDSPERHIARVASRVARGGHDIPEDAIRRRYDNSRKNLIGLLPRLTVLRMFDNSAEADPQSEQQPKPRLILHLEGGKVIEPRDLSTTPEWAKPIVAAALKTVTFCGRPWA
jgi:predicted ABC-type ATPase